MKTTAARWYALAAISLALLAVGLDIMVLSVALPTLAADLHATESQLQWFSSGYALVLAAGMLPAGLLGDRYGRKRVLLGAMVLFGIGSIACAYAPTPEIFIAARLVLGAAGSAMIVMALSVLTVLFDEQERPRAIAIWGAANFLALPIGPILGGWIIANAWWGWVFLINVPVALVGFIAVVALVPESRSPERPGVDLPGVLGASGGLALLTYGLIQAGDAGWASLTALGSMAGGIAILVAFFAWEARLTRRPGGQPLIDLGLFRSPAFTWGLILVAIGMMSLVGMLFTMPQFSTAVLGADAQGSGLRLLPIIAGFVVGAGLSSRLAVLVGVKLTTAAGLAITAGTMLVAATTTVSSSDAFISAWEIVAGAGMGLGFVAAATGAVVELPTDRAGVGAAVMQAVQKLGAPFGAAILGSVLNAGYQDRLQVPGLPAQAAEAAQSSVFGGLAVAQQLGSPELAATARAAFVSGMDDALRVSALFAVAGVLLALAFMPRWARDTSAAPSGASAPRPAVG